MKIVNLVSIKQFDLLSDDPANDPANDPAIENLAPFVTFSDKYMKINVTNPNAIVL